jgi:polysaccharide deacetylase family protein (PEP-CTERM system associated)
MQSKITNAMTVDVEDYFHVSAFDNVIDKKEWDNLPLRVEYNVYRLLELFEQHNAKCTFFTLGWVAQRCPQLIEAIVAQGHELASHGFSHQRTTQMTRAEVTDDIERSKKVLEDISGQEILGYRAPSFSINDSNTWVFEVLKELGFKYSSSTYPIKHDLYGVPDWPRFAYQRDEGVLEIPIPTIQKNGKNIGIGGGGFFRLYPYWFSKNRINKFHREEYQPYSFYFHPWEIDPNQPRIKEASLKSKFRHYVNLNTMEGKLAKLLKDYQWDTMTNVYLKKVNLLTTK